MEITTENKFKAALQYYGQPFLVCYNIENNPVIEKFEYKNSDPFMYEPDINNKRDLLLLKKLSSITDEDAIEVCKMGKILLIPDQIHIFKNSFGDTCVRNKDDVFSTTCIKYDQLSIKQYQYLQSRGYDLPSYLLGGKTLQEAGLAIYE